MTPERNVAVIVDSADPYDRKILAGVADYAKERGTWGLYVELDALQKLPDLPTWQGHGIIASFDDRRVADAVRNAGVPVVGLGGGHGWYDTGSRVPYFHSDQEGVARLAAAHLLDRGFHNLAFCGYPRTRINGWSDERGRAFAKCAEEAGVPCSIYRCGRETARKWTDLQRDLTTWISSLKKPVGLMAGNDARARHVIEVCRAIRVPVPDEVAIIGVDNDELLCELTNPPLSSVEQGARQMGYGAAELLDQMMSGQKPQQLRYVVRPTGVVVRRSTDTLAISDPELVQTIRFIRD